MYSLNVSFGKVIAIFYLKQIDWQSDPVFIAQLFWPYKIHIYFRLLSPL